MSSFFARFRSSPGSPKILSCADFATMTKEHGDSSYGSLTILGPAKSSVAGDHSAERLASIVCRMNGFLCTLHHDDFVGDNLQWYIARYLKWLCTHLIPHSFNDELEPTNPRNKKCLLTRSLLIYVGKHLHYIRTTFGHPDFDKLGSNEYPTWWMSYWVNFTRECDKFQMINAIGDDVAFGDLDVLPCIESFKIPTQMIRLVNETSFTGHEVL